MCSGLEAFGHNGNRANYLTAYQFASEIADACRQRRTTALRRSPSTAKTA